MREKEYRELKKNGLYPFIKENHSFLDILEEYREYLEKKRKPTTVCLRYKALKNHLIPYFEGILYENVKNEDLRGFNDFINTDMKDHRVGLRPL